MEEFVIRADGPAEIRFFDRSPEDRLLPIEEFWVSLKDHNLAAIVRVWAGYTHAVPTPLFASMAAQWAGWPGELTWESLEHDLKLRCTRDRVGHIAIGVTLRSDWGSAWRVEATVDTAAGQLESLARNAARFFG